MGKGEFDYLEAASEVFEADFFRFIQARADLSELTGTYPMPRKKEEVPFWFYVASNLSMRLHGVHAFDAFPLVVRSGGMLQALGPKAGRKVVHPETKETPVFCEGFNRKNHYDRETPCDAVANRETYADGHQEIWFLVDTREVQDPLQTRQEYHLRPCTEGRYRQLKCFNDLTHFTSRAFSLVVNQVVFILLAYDLLQIYLLRQGRKDLNPKTLPRIRQQLLPSDNYLLVYWQNYYGLFRPFELVGFVVMLGEEARKKIAAQCRRIGRELNGLLQNPRPP